MIEVIKFGGSLCQPDALTAAIAWMARQAQSHSIVVVCGGGAYADTIRSEQKRLALDDVVAHRQALLAMEQTALLVQRAWYQKTGVELPLSESGDPMTLWSPRGLLFDHQEVPASWDITSDSLSVWLAHKIQAQQLSLMKNLDLGLETGSPKEWQAKGWVDHAFCDLALNARYPIGLVGRRLWGQAIGAVEGRTHLSDSTGI